MINNFESLINECDLLIDELSPSLPIYNEQIILLKKLASFFENYKAREISNHYLFAKHIVYLNSYVAITTMDLAVNLKNLVNNEKEWEKIFFIKNAFLVVFESSNKLDATKHSFIYENLKKFFPEFIQSCNLFNSKLQEFKEDKNYTLIRNVRNNVSAHIETKIEKYFKVAYSLDGEECAAIISNYNSILLSLIPILKELQIKVNQKTNLIDSQIKNIANNA